MSRDLMSIQLYETRLACRKVGPFPLRYPILKWSGSLLRFKRFTITEKFANPVHFQWGKFLPSTLYSHQLFHHCCTSPMGNILYFIALPLQLFFSFSCPANNFRRYWFATSYHFLYVLKKKVTPNFVLESLNILERENNCCHGSATYGDERNLKTSFKNCY